MFESVGAETVVSTSNLFGNVGGAVGKSFKIQITRNDLLSETIIIGGNEQSATLKCRASRFKLNAKVCFLSRAMLTLSA
jgi:hypothetical protein